MNSRRKRSRLPGIVDVANHARVSPATVSRYFNDPDVVRLRTRERIRKAVDDLGYVRNRAMLSMVGGATGSIGLVIPTLDNAIFSEMLQTLSSALATHSRTMVIAAHGYDMEREAVLVHTLLEQRVDALALVGLDHLPETMALIDRQGCPAAFLWNYREGLDRPCIGFDNVQAGHFATRHLIGLGHKDILFATGEELSNDRAASRRRGAMQAAAEAGIAVEDHRRLTCPYDIQDSKDKIAAALTRQPRPTAILAGNDVIAQGAMFAAAAQGITVPDDLSIIGIGDFQGSSAFEPGLTTLRIPARRIGNLAAEALVEMIDGFDDSSQHQHCCSVELVERGTCRAVAA